MSAIQAPIATIVDLFEQRDRRIASLEAEKAANAASLTALADRLFDMLEQRIALLTEVYALLEEKIALKAAEAKAKKAANDWGALEDRSYAVSKQRVELCEELEALMDAKWA